MPDSATIENADIKKHFTAELFKRLQNIKDEGQQQWYMALVCSAMDQTEQDIDKSFSVADKAFAEDKYSQPPATKSVTKLSRLKKK